MASLNKFILQKLMLPNPSVCDIKEMFFRSSARYDFARNSIISDGPTHIDLHSYFNIIPVRHYFENFDISNLNFSAIFDGTAEFIAYSINIGFSEPIFIASSVVSGEGQEVSIFNSLDISTITGYIYIVINTHTPFFELKELNVNCLSEREFSSVGIVICTFRRESYVLRTAKAITDSFDLYPKEFKNTDLYVIDNDECKKLNFEKHYKLNHVSNKNLGGAGGFTRGIIECLNSNKSYVLLCDDDVLLAGETVRRAVVALSLAKDPNAGLHGSMLEVESQATLHEMGEYFDKNKRFHINMHYGENMTDIHKLKLVALESIGNTKTANMFGWWFTAFPLSLVKKIGLPLPLFVSGDDLEYSLRAVDAGYKSFISPSISVWHPSHMLQHAPLRTYFIVRNRLAYLSIHTNSSRVSDVIRNILKEAKHMALSKRYATADSICAAVEDYFRGCAWFKEDLSDWIRSIRWINREKTGRLYDDKWLMPINPISSLKPESVWNYIVRKISFGGHIFPNLFHSKADHPSSFYHKSIPNGVSPIGVDVERIAFRSSSILFYDPRGLVGFRVEHNTWMFWRVYFRILTLRFRSFAPKFSLIRRYKNTFLTVISERWWKDRLGI